MYKKILLKYNLIASVIDNTDIVPEKVPDYDD